MTVPAIHDLEARARWHLDIGYPPQSEVESCAYVEFGDLDDLDDPADAVCIDCGKLHDICECHVGDDCGRWRNGNLSSSCLKAGSEECDFECPHRSTLRF